MTENEKKALRLLATRLYHTAAIGMKLNACDWSKVIKVAKELEALGEKGEPSEVWTLISEITNVNSEGVGFTLTEKAALNGLMKSDQWYVSWDKIGKALFGEQYSNEKRLDRDDSR